MEAMKAVSYTHLDVYKRQEWTKSPVNLAQYVVENDNQIKVFLNPAAIIAAVNNAGPQRETNN